MPTILLTRPADGSDRFARDLRARLGDVPVVISPVLAIRPTDAVIDLHDDPVPIFTSVNGVAGFVAQHGAGCGLCYTVGRTTAEAARKAGFAPVSADGAVGDLVALIAQDRPRQRLLHLRGVHAAGDLVGDLRKIGLNADSVAVYDQGSVPLTDTALALLDRENPVVLPLFSPRSAAEVARQHRGGAPLFVAAMSDAVAQAVRDLSCAVLRVANRPDAGAMLETTEGLWRDALMLERQDTRG